MKILITGATGMVGAEVVRQALQDNDITEIVALVRKPLEIRHLKIKTVIHTNFLEYNALGDLFANCHACIWCLGISQSQVTKKQYEIITYDYTVNAAKAMLAANAAMSFIFVSGEGADSTEKSPLIFARTKGKIENALLKLCFPKLVIARPAGIRPIHKNKNAALLYKFIIPFYPLLELLIPSKVIDSVRLANALLYLTKNKTGNVIFENTDLQQIGLIINS